MTFRRALEESLVLGSMGEGVDFIDSPDPAIQSLKARMLREVDLRAVRPPGPAQPLTEDAKERLRALGYLK